MNTNLQRRQANVYDAVAGHITSNGFLTTPYTSKFRDTLSSNSIPYRPEEVLFRRKNAPIRYEEEDFYFANEKLQPNQQLPDSDLLKALHQYTSDMYGNVAGDVGENDWYSLDGTALLALGILVEEAAKESLGDAGDLVFLEKTKNETKADEGSHGTGPSVVLPKRPLELHDPSKENARGRKKRRLRAQSDTMEKDDNVDSVADLDASRLPSTE